MNNTAKKRIINRIRAKLSGRQGFSLGELLAATIILLLASQVMAQGIAFATRMYNETLSRSHAKQLCSTLTNSIETELRYATSASLDTNGILTSYFSIVYGQTQSGFVALDENGESVSGTTGGELAIKVTDKDTNQVIWQRLISSASYSSYDLKAEASNIKYNEENNTFHVVLNIDDKNEKKLVSSEFDVIPVNKLSIKQQATS